MSLNGTRVNYIGSQLNNAVLDVNAREFRIGGDNNYGSFSGQLNEVLVFENKLSVAEMDQVETYLAIKYGTTFGAGIRNYKNASGATVWEAATHVGYINNIAGIGNDAALNQKQSWSTNDGQQILISTTGLNTTNAANGVSLSGGQYLIWGDNGLAKTPTVAITGISTISHRFASIWKVQNTGSVGTVRVAWPKNLANLSLIQSTDNIIASGDAVTPMTGETTIGGVVYNYADVTLADGEFFTLGAKLAAPGGVSGPAVWLKADEGTTLSGTSVSGWANYGVSGGVAGQLARTTTVNWALPKYGENEHNFNPAIVDDVATSNDGSLLLADVFPGSAHRALNSFVLQSHSDMVTHQNMIAYTPLKQTSGALEAPYMGAYTNSATRPWFYWEGRYEVAPTWPNSVTRYANIPAVNAFYVPQFVAGTPHTVTFGMNGATVNGNTYNSGATTLPFGNQLFIFGDGQANNTSGGKISEVISYDKVLTTIERQQVNSYLAIKYGITLTNPAGTATDNYLNSTANVVWDATANAGYNKNIAGLANDVASTLNQKQSKSVNAGQQVLIATIGLNQTNILNTTSLTTNGQYLIWGDNGLSKTLSVSITGVVGLNLRFAAIWKVQNTGSTGTIRVAWPAGIPNMTLIQSPDAVFDAGDTRTNMTSNTQTINGVPYNYADVTLADGQYFTFAGYVIGPGGVASAAWYRADAAGQQFTDAGTTIATDGQTLQQWNEYKGTGYNFGQVTAGRRPTFSNTTTLANFNPTVTFGGGDQWMYYDPGVGNAIIDRVNGSLYAAGRVNTLSGAGMFGFDESMDYPGLHFYNDGAAGYKGLFFSYPTGPGYQGLSQDAIPNKSYFTLGAGWQNGAGSSAGFAGATVSFNGTRKDYSGAELYNVDQTVNARDIMLGKDNNYGQFYGQLNELVAFENRLTVDDMDRVETYMAIKYGTTFAKGIRDYKNSTLGTIWSATTNNGYHYNIAGIGRDDEGSLLQKQSWSTNTQREVLISTTGLENTNAANTVVLTNGQFLIWGDNNLAKAPTVAISGISGVNYRFASIWKVQNTGNIGTVRIAWPAGFTNFKLIQSPDNNITSSDDITDMAGVQTVNGVDYAYADVTLTNGQYFTFAAFIQAPGGVTNNLSYWYRADKLVGSSGVGTEVTSWTDFTLGTLSTQLGDNAGPILSQGSSTYLNFNPGLNFTAATQSLGNLSVRTFNSSAYDVFVLTKDGITPGGNGRIFSSLIDNSLLSGSINYWDAFGDMADNRSERVNTAQNYRFLATVGGNRPTTYPGIVYHNLMNTTTGKAINGAVVSTSSAHTAIGSPNGGHAFGSTVFSSNGSDNAGFIGNLGEVVVYGNGNVTAPERNKVESYLAIKYGVTLASTNNYTSSQDVVVWDAAANAGFYYNVAGIGNDFISALHQKQSRSQHPNTNNQVIIGLGDIAETNIANSSSLANGQFLMWGDNNITQSLSAAFTTFSYGGTTFSRRMNRVWKVQNTNNVSGTVKISFPQASVGTTTLTANDACAAYVIIYADDAAFTTNVTAVPVTVNGTDYETTHSFPNGTSYFTYGKVTPITSGVVYLPPVVEVTNQVGDNCGIASAWTYFRKSDDASLKLLATSGVATAPLTTTITPEGTVYDDGTVVTSLMPRISTVTDASNGTYSGVKVRVYYNEDELNASIVPGAATSGWFKYEGNADDVLADVYGDGLLDIDKATALTPNATGIEDGVRYVEFHTISSFSSFIYISSTEDLNVLLPVSLLHFNVQKTQGAGVLLSWSTASEQNNKGFEIERSLDGRNWSSIGFVGSNAGNGNSSLTLLYTFTDLHPANGSNYYRLRQVGLDGQTNYSPQKHIILGQSTSLIALAPNPVRHSVVISGLNGKNTLVVRNSVGQAIANVSIQNTTNYTLNMVNYIPGVYFVSITNQDGSITNHKLIKE